MTPQEEPFAERQAVRDLETQIRDGRRELRPDLAEARTHLALALGMGGDLEGAVAQCQQAIALYEQLAREGPADLRAPLAAARYNLAVARSQQGLLDEAAAEYRAVAALYAELVGECRSELRGELAFARYNLGHTLLLQARQQARSPLLAEAAAEFRNVVRLCEALVGEGQADVRELLIMAHNNLGAALGYQGKMEAAADELHRAEALQAELAGQAGEFGAGEASGPPGRADSTAAYHSAGASRPPGPAPIAPADDLGDRLEQARAELQAVLRGQLPAAQAVRSFLQVIAEAEESLQVEPTPGLLALLALARNDLGTLFGRAGRLAQAEQEFREAAALYDELFQDYPAAADKLGGELAKALMNLGSALAGLGHAGEAVEELRRANALHAGLIGQGRADLRSELAKTRMNLGGALVQLGAPEEGAAELRQALADFGELYAAGETEYRLDLARTRVNLGGALNEQGLTGDAAREYEQALGLYEEMLAEGRGEIRAESVRVRGAWKACGGSLRR